MKIQIVERMQYSSRNEILDLTEQIKFNVFSHAGHQIMKTFV